MYLWYIIYHCHREGAFIKMSVSRFAASTKFVQISRLSDSLPRTHCWAAGLKVLANMLVSVSSNPSSLGGVVLSGMERRLRLERKRCRGSNVLLGAGVDLALSRRNSSSPALESLTRGKSASLLIQLRQMTAAGRHWPFSNRLLSISRRKSTCSDRLDAKSAGRMGKWGAECGACTVYRW
jgi:hypothetical protein